MTAFKRHLRMSVKFL